MEYGDRFTLKLEMDAVGGGKEPERSALAILLYSAPEVLASPPEYKTKRAPILEKCAIIVHEYDSLVDICIHPDAE